MSPNQPVSVKEISDRVWGERPPGESRKTIERYVGNIRGRLRELIGSERVRILGKQGTYTLQVDPETIDVCRFHRLRKEAITAERSGALERAIELYRAAESLCGGDPLAGLPGSWARRAAQDLAEKLLSTRRARIGLELRLGRYEQVLDELSALVERYPNDEVLIAHRMRALAESGRRGEALEVYRRARAYLTENQGLEPNRELFDLHQRILRADGEPNGRRGVPGPMRLPSDIPHFIGREREMELIAAVRADRRGAGLVVIEGLPGVGKTALAVHAAHMLAADYPEARLYLNLKAHHPTHPPLDPRTALAELLGMLGVSGSELPDTLDERAALWRRLAADLRAIVVLDDADGLEQVRPLLPAEPDRLSGLVLVTGRRRMDLIPGMRRIPLRVLAEPQAARLWSRLTDDGPPPTATRRMLRVCAGLPLAIAELARRLRDQTASPLIRRISGVTEAVELSYRRLSTEQQRAFRRLGLFPGQDLTVDVASVLTDTVPEVAADLVDALLRRHLIEEGENGRYRFHRLVREVARDLARRADPTREIRAAERRLLRHYIDTAVAADRSLFRDPWKTRTNPEPDGRAPLEPSAARDWFDAEWRNILQLARYAAEHEWKAKCAELTHAVAEYLDYSRRFAEAAEGHMLAVRACRDIGDHLGLARASLDLSLVRFRTACYDEAVYQAKEAKKLFEARGHLRQKGRCLERLGLAHWGKDLRRRALAYWDEAADIYREVGDRKGMADILRLRSMAKCGLGQYVDADRQADEALQIYREIGDRFGEMKTLTNKGQVAQARARHREADGLYRDALAILKETTGCDNHAILDHNQGDLHMYKEQPEIALEYYARALAAYREAGDRQYKVDVLNAIAEAYLKMERPQRALGYFQTARAVAADIGRQSQEAQALTGIAAAHRDMDNHRLALGIYEEALGMAQQIEDYRQRAVILDGQARAWSRCGRNDLARVAWREARGLYEDIGLTEFAEEIRLKLETLGTDSMDID